MALSWEAIASQNTDLLRKSMNVVPKKPTNTTWINYARCHDDIGLGFEDYLIHELGKNPLEKGFVLCKKQMVMLD